MKNFDELKNINQNFEGFEQHLLICLRKNDVDASLRLCKDMPYISESNFFQKIYPYLADKNFEFAKQVLKDYPEHIDENFVNTLIYHKKFMLLEVIDGVLKDNFMPIFNKLNPLSTSDYTGSYLFFLLHFAAFREDDEVLKLYLKMKYDNNYTAENEELVTYSILAGVLEREKHLSGNQSINLDTSTRIQKLVKEIKDHMPHFINDNLMFEALGNHLSATKEIKLEIINMTKEKHILEVKNRHKTKTKML